ncbi:MAG: TIGR00282 family metallophosphoesterase [Phycisphaerales bacterium]|nr:TIGR00282 family metallophosphoesterase [Phycisphaerales bacterium]
MRILLIGDIVGRPGKHACSQIIPALIRDRHIDFVVANAENTCAGSGLTPAMFRKLMHYGIDVCTMGDHIYKRREIVAVLNQSDQIVRPANLPLEAAGREMTIVKSRLGPQVAVISVLGRIFMNMRGDCPFHAVDRLIASLPDDVKIVLVDVHAEATSEKVALGWHLDGRATAVVGTHTHVQTADERVLPGGTAYITDLGMTGPHDSVLGRDKRAVIENLITTMPIPYAVAGGDPKLNGVIVECDPATGRATGIERISIREESPIPVSDDD